MTGLTLTLKAGPRRRLDLGALAPAASAARTLAEIERLPLRFGRRTVPLGEHFSVKGEPGDALAIEAEGAFLDRLGAGFASGAIRVRGDLGFYAGEGMTGGLLEVSGSVGDFAGCGMTGGVLKIAGDAGDFLGSARPGERHGQAGGAILVKGCAGDRTGDRMRRGLILVDGAIGADAASRMLAGTIAAGGGTGPRPGFGMQRGTLLIRTPGPEMLSTFVFAGALELGFLELLRRRVAHLGSWLSQPDFSSRRVSRYIGDRAADGRGEIVILA